MSADLTRVCQQRQLERIELLTRRSTLTVVHRSRTNLNTPEGGNFARSVGRLLVVRGILSDGTTCTHLDGLDRFARPTFTSRTELNEGHETLTTSLQFAVAVDDVSGHVDGEAFSLDRAVVVSVENQIAFDLFASLALLILEMEADINLEVCWWQEGMKR